MKYASKQFYHRESIEIVGTTHRSTFFRWSENQKQRRACVVASAFVAKIVNIQKTFIMYSQKVRGERLNWSSKSFHSCNRRLMMKQAKELELPVFFNCFLLTE